MFIFVRCCFEMFAEVIYEEFFETASIAENGP